MTTIKLLTPQGDFRRWHQALAAALAANGADVLFDVHPGVPPPASLSLLAALERLVLLRDRHSATESIAPGAWFKLSKEPADLIFDLTGRPQPAPDAIFPTYDGICGDAARDNILLDGRAPRIDLVKATDGAMLSLMDGLPALERPDLLVAGQDAIAKRLITLIRGLVSRRGAVGGVVGGRPITPSPYSEGSAAGFLAAMIVSKAGNRLKRLVAHEGHWRVGWRQLRNTHDSTLERLAWPEARWNWLADDLRRYYADPFLFEADGVVHVFCEEYPYATRKAVISHFTLDAQGNPVAPPQVVLERPHHLSYPFVFRHGGDIWMMPESSTGPGLELFRADPFPTRWTLDRILVDSEALSDATVFGAGDRYWLTASTSEDQGSSWDCLSLYAGPAPVGPWSRCGDGPVLIDASAARPAGCVVEIGGKLWRPAQDCTGRYGSGLALCRIDRIDEAGLAQTVAARLKPPAGGPAQGVHTINAAFGIEIIDAVGPRLKLDMRQMESDQ